MTADFGASVPDARPDRAIRRLSAIAQHIGVTRIGDATGFDRIGIPVWQAVRPRGRSLSVSQGKGATATQAATGAVMEAAEAWCAEHLRPANTRVASIKEAALWSAHLVRPDGGVFDGPLGWLPAVDLLSGRAVDVPRAFVSLDHGEPRPKAFAANSTGLAAGYDGASTLIRALAEVAERGTRAKFHAMSVRERHACRIAVGEVRCRRVQWAATRVHRAGCGLLAWDIADDPQVPCCVAAITELTAGPFPMPVALASATAPTAEQALLKVIAECAQVRVTLLAGARDDLRREHYPRDARAADRDTLDLILEGGGADAGRPLPVRAPPPRDGAGWGERLLAYFARGGARGVIASELGRAAVGLAVRKVIVPGWPDAART